MCGSASLSWPYQTTHGSDGVGETLQRAQPLGDVYHELPDEVRLFKEIWLEYNSIIVAAILYIYY